MAFLVDFYHYTSEVSADAIISSGFIYESQSGGPDAFYGTGVYGTLMPPSAGKKKIASNNWKQGWRQRERKGRVDYAFHIRIPRNKVEEYRIPSRHLYLHKGPIYLDNYEWELLEV